MVDGEQFLVFRCSECKRCFGKLSATGANSCPACGSTTKHLIIDRATDEDDLQTRVSSANIPSELRKDLGEKIDKMQPYDDGGEDSVTTGRLRAILEQSVDEDGRISPNRLQNALDKEEITEPSAEELISMAESQGALIRSSDGDWHWLE